MGRSEEVGEQFLPIGQKGGKCFRGEGTEKANQGEGKCSILSFSSLRKQRHSRTLIPVQKEQNVTV